MIDRRNDELKFFEMAFRQWTQDNGGEFHNEFKGEPVVAASFFRNATQIQVWVEEIRGTSLELCGWKMKGDVTRRRIDLEADKDRLVQELDSLLASTLHTG